MSYYESENTEPQLPAVLYISSPEFLVQYVIISGPK
jgi:hypothetical protein